MNFFFVKCAAALLSAAVVLFPLPLFAENGLDRSNVYVVKKGDTLNSIGRRYGVAARDIAQRNSISNPNKIHVGQVLVIPTGDDAIGSNPLPKKTASAPAAAPRNNYAFEEEYAPAPGKTALNLQGEEAHDLEEHHLEKDSGKDPHRHYIGASMTGWFAFIDDAEVRADSGVLKGTGIDLNSALGVDEDVTIPVVNAWIEPFSWLKVQGEYMEFDVRGSRTIDESITFEGFTFDIFDRVSGNLEVQRASGWIELNPIRGKWGYIGGLVGGEYAHVEAKLSSDLVGSVREEADAGTVALGGQARIFLTDEIEIGARGRTFSYEISDIDFSFVDFQADISYTVFGHFDLMAGYRLLVLEVGNDEAEGELTLHGPFIAGGLKI